MSTKGPKKFTKNGLSFKLVNGKPVLLPNQPTKSLINFHQHMLPCKEIQFDIKTTLQDNAFYKNLRCFSQCSTMKTPPSENC